MNYLTTKDQLADFRKKNIKALTQAVNIRVDDPEGYARALMASMVNKICPTKIDPKNPPPKFTKNSLIEYLLKAAKVGITVDHYAPIVYGDKMTLVIMVGGWYELLTRHGFIANAIMVRDGEKFRIRVRDNKTSIDHDINPLSDQPFVFGYARISVKGSDQIEKFEIIKIEELDKIKDKQIEKTGSWAWKLHPVEMYKKTLIRKVIKSSGLLDEGVNLAVDEDNRTFNLRPQQLTRPVGQSTLRAEKPPETLDKPTEESIL